MHNQISHHLFCAIVFRCLCVLCAIFWHGFACFAFFGAIFCVSQGNAQKNAKKIANKMQIQSKTNAKAKTRTLLIAVVLLFDSICFAFVAHVCRICCAFLVHFCCIACAFFAFVQWTNAFFFFSHFVCFFCIPRHPLVTCFCMHFLMFCCVIRSSFSVHHNSFDQ